MVLADDTIPQNWDVTSDSIAAWLAQKMDATHLILLKSDKPNESKLGLKAITEDGLVDFSFQNFVQNKLFSTWVVGKSDYAHFEDGACGLKLAKIAAEIH
jgi:5-(aminomethyl)-3-furanmethanol phosphate kinase